MSVNAVFSLKFMSLMEFDCDIVTHVNVAYSLTSH